MHCMNKQYILECTRQPTLIVEELPFIPGTNLIKTIFKKSFSRKKYKDFQLPIYIHSSYDNNKKCCLYTIAFWNIKYVNYFYKPFDGSIIIKINYINSNINNFESIITLP